MLTLPLLTYWPSSLGVASSAKCAQWSQVSEPYSTSFTGASGLPTRKPPSGVLATVFVQSLAASAWAAGTAAIPKGSAAAANRRASFRFMSADRSPYARLELVPGGGSLHHFAVYHERVVSRSEYHTSVLLSLILFSSS